MREDMSHMHDKLMRIDPEVIKTATEVTAPLHDQPSVLTQQVQAQIEATNGIHNLITNYNSDASPQYPPCGAA